MYTEINRKCVLYLLFVRLWAASGQSALESAHVLVLSSSATSTSILKNLVLPGVGNFTILDSGKATAEDVGNNFFLDGPDSIGKYRAEEAVRLLKELNENVSGTADTRVRLVLLRVVSFRLTNFFDQSHWRTF